MTNQLSKYLRQRYVENRGLTPRAIEAVLVARAVGRSLAFAAAALASALGCPGASARADVVIHQGFAIGPSGLDGAASFAAWAPNAIQGIRNGFQPVGNFANAPTAFQPITSFNLRDVIPTSDFNSWRGFASPQAPFANELGNLLYSPIDIVDRGAKLSLSQVVFTGVSSDNPNNPAGSLLGSVLDLKNFSYNSGRVGIIHNPDGTTTLVTSGSSDQLVDEIVYRGVGSYDVDLQVAGSGKTGQQLLDAEVGVFARAMPLSFSANYTVYKDNVSRDPGSILASSTATISANAIPEPSCLALAAVGGLAFLGAAWRRRSRFNQSQVSRTS
jgi:hypothetical protein